MIYLSWLALYEGPTDRAYLEVLIPRLMEAIGLAEGRQEIIVPASSVGGQPLSREIERFAAEACALKDAVHILFVHADTGGRGLARGLHHRGCAYCKAVEERCEWPAATCVVVAPRHEMEAWALADPAAVCSSMGYAGNPADLALPANAAAADRLVDPKGTLEAALALVRRRRSRQPAQQLLPAIAQGQSIAALRASPSFKAFELNLRSAMVALGCLEQPR
jgi:hypothetical protein